MATYTSLVYAIRTLFESVIAERFDENTVREKLRTISETAQSLGLERVKNVAADIISRIESGETRDIEDSIYDLTNLVTEELAQKLDDVRRILCVE